jgi:hypothetical protein
LLPALLVLATAGGGALLAAGPALGATAPAGPSNKAITQRLASLHTWQTKLAADKTLTPAHRTALTDLLGQDVTGLTALQATIASDIDPAARKTDAAKIYTDYRIYALVARQVDDTVAADRIAAAVGPLQTTQQRLTARLAAQPGGGTAAQKAARADLGQQLGILQAATSAGDAVLALHPADVPDLQHLPAALTSADAEVKAAQAAAKAARADVKTLRGVLPKAARRQADGAAATATTT